MGRYRSIERTQRRGKALDRTIAILLVVLGLTGTLSLLPSHAQSSVGRLACQIGSLGLSNCIDSTAEAAARSLAPAQCRTLARLDEVIPEAQVTSLTTASGVPLTWSTTRSGEDRLRFAADAEVPDLISGQGRSLSDPTAGVTLTMPSEWFLPGGQGGQELVEAIDAEHRRWVQQRSALALLSGVLDSSGWEIPEPTILRSHQDPRVSPLPTATGQDEPPRPKSGRWLAIDTDRSAEVSVNTTTAQSNLTVPLQGELDGEDITGRLRWTINSVGEITEVVIGFTTAQDPFAEDASEEDADGAENAATPSGPAAADALTDVVYLSIPVRTRDERQVTLDWLTREGGVMIDLGTAMSTQVPAAEDRFGSFLARSATIVSLTYTGVSVGAADAQLGEQFALDERGPWEEADLVEARQMDPQPVRVSRDVTTDEGCTG